MVEMQRRIGLEQEFFLVDRSGELTNRADEFLAACREIALQQNLNPAYFVPEFVKSMVEINTPPANSAADLAKIYLQHLNLAVQAARSIDLCLYPLSSYPLHIMPIMRDKPIYHIQSRILGADRYLHAGKCTGTHLHLEAPPGSLDTQVGVAYRSTPLEQAELLSTYNLATALDAALIALSRACPFYEGQAIGLASHTIRYRGSEEFGWEGVFTPLQILGGLRPYADSIEQLVELQFERHYHWLAAMDRAGVDRQLFFATGGNLLKSAWNPVRLNPVGTVEIRSIDSNYPMVILAILSLVYHTAHRVWQEQLTVRPDPDATGFELDGDRLWVPSFEYLNGKLLYAAATEGIKHPAVNAYVDSILNFALADDGAGARYLAKLRSELDQYRTIEAEILQAFVPATAELSREEGLRLVQACCQTFEQQIVRLDVDEPMNVLDGGE